MLINKQVSTGCGININEYDNSLAYFNIQI